MKKRLTAFCAALALLLGLCACGKTAEQPTWQEQYDLGVRYLSEGKYQEAILAFEAAIEIDPKQPAAYAELANVYLAVDDAAQAVAVLERGFAATGDAGLQARLDELSEPEPTPTPTPESTLEPAQESNQINANEDAWLFTDNMIGAEELTVGGVPFWRTTIEKVSELFPIGEEYGDPWIVFDGGKQYTAFLNRVSYVSAQQMSDSAGLNDISFTAGANYTELRDINFGISQHRALEKLGLTNDGIDYCMSFDFGKVLRFVCTEDIWTEDIKHGGTVSPGSKIELIWPNFNSEQELILTLDFDETDSLTRILYFFVELGY